jgi:hypothetical protein
MDLIAETVSARDSDAYSHLLGVVVLLGFSFAALIFFVVALVKASRNRTRGWVITAALSGIAMLGGLTWAVAMVAETVASSAREEKAAGLPATELSSPDGKFSIKVPVSWTAMPELHPAAAIAAGDKDHEQYMMVLPTPREKFPASAADFEVFVTEGLKQALEDSKASEPEEIQVGGFKAIRRSISGLKNGNRLAYEQVVVETRNTFYQILLWTVFSHRSVAEQKFRDIVASFAAEAGPPLPE